MQRDEQFTEYVEQQGDKFEEITEQLDELKTLFLEKNRTKRCELITSASLNNSMGYINCSKKPN